MGVLFRFWLLVVLHLSGGKMQDQKWFGISESYLKKGLSVIPVKGKVPQVENWQRWCSESPDEPIVTNSQTGIGLCLGPASDLVAVDIDTDDPKILALVPPSPIIRRGKKGEVRLFKYSKDIQSRTYRDWSIEILSVGRQAVLPPSIHPDTGVPYVWTNGDLLDFDLDLLPTLDLSFLNNLGQVQIPQQTVGGRHNKLKDIVIAILTRGEPVEFAAKEAYEYDKEFHADNRWFMDQGDIWKAKTEGEAQKCASIFVGKMYISLLNGDIVQPILNFQAMVGEEEVSKAKLNKFELKQYPEPEGALKDFCELIIESSYTRVPNMALGSAISIFSVLLGNRCAFEDVKANIFCLLLADSGTGKKFGISVARDLLGSMGHLGSADYLSSSAIGSSLSDYCLRLDVSDEFSKTLKLAKDGNPWQMAMLQDLCRLWSASTDGFDLPMVKRAKEDKGKELPSRIISPFISILSATTLSEFKDSINRSVFTSGFVPRFLIFMDQPSREIKTRLDYDKISPMKHLCASHVKNLLASHQANPITGHVTAGQWTVADEDMHLYEEMMRGYHFEAMDEPNELIKPIIARSREQMKKLALIHAVSRVDTSGKIRARDLNWASEVIATSLHNSAQFLAEASAENRQQAEKEKVINLIKSQPGIQQRDLKRAIRFIQPNKRRDAVIKDLCDDNLIVYTETKCEKNGKSIKKFFAAPVDSH